MIMMMMMMMMMMIMIIIMITVMIPDLYVEEFYNYNVELLYYLLYCSAMYVNLYIYFFR